MNIQLEHSSSGIERTIMNNLGEYGLLAISEIEVRVRDEVAYVEGCVSNLTQKKLVEEIIVEIEGIHQVVNMLKITPMAVVDDESLLELIRSALEANPQINDATISIEASNGCAYLQGFVRTAAEKCRVELEIWATCGVRSVTNDIHVLSESPLTDAEIAYDILQGFCDCLDIGLSAVDVEYRDGVVHLKGTVPNSLIKAAAEDLAFWNPSVVAVVNDIEVATKLGPKPQTSSNAEGDLPKKSVSDRSKREKEKAGFQGL